MIAERFCVTITELNNANGWGEIGVSVPRRCDLHSTERGPNGVPRRFQVSATTSSDIASTLLAEQMGVPTMGSPTSEARSR